MIKHPGLQEFGLDARSSPDDFGREAAVRVAQPLDLAQAIEYIQRRLLLIVQCMLIGGGLSVAAALLIGPTFTATALLAVAEQDAALESKSNESAVDTQIAMLQSQAFLDRAYGALAATPELAAAASSPTALEQRLRVLQESKSRLISVSYSAKSPTLAADVANKIVRLYVEDPVLQSVQSVDDVTLQYATRIIELQKKLNQLTNAPAGKGGAEQTASTLAEQEGLRDQIATLQLNENLVSRRQESRRQMLAMAPPVQLVALATPPRRRSSLNPLLILGPGLLFSTLFGVGLALILGRLDKRIYTAEQLEHLVHRKCAAEIAPKPTAKRARKKASSSAYYAYARCVEALVTKTVLLPAQQPRLMLLTASEAGWHAPQIVEDFARAAARVLPRVLVVDIDIARGQHRASLLQRLRGRETERPRPDIFDVLSGRRTINEAIERKAQHDFYLLPLRSPILDDPFSLIASDRFRKLLDDLMDEFSLVLIAGPPMSDSHEAQLIGRHVDAALIFVCSGASLQSSVLGAFAGAEQSLGVNSRSLRPQLSGVLLEARRSAKTATIFPATAMQTLVGAAERAKSFGVSPLLAPRSSAVQEDKIDIRESQP